jgi:histidinol dehydrogenase
MRIFRYSVPKEARAFEAYCQSREERFPPAVIAKVSGIVSAVKKGGDRALLGFTRRFDGVSMKASSLRVPVREMASAWKATPKADRQAMKTAWDNITRFHRAQLQLPVTVRVPYGVLRQVPVPIERVGVHVPAGRAPLVSTFLMVAGAARAAGVRDVVMFSPPRFKGKMAAPILAAGYMAGIREAYAVGGAQGVAAMVYGTKSVRPVDRVAGPGNVFVQAAKWLTQAGAGCEGASELLVLADRTAPPRAVAADLLAQAEHTGNEYAVLVTDSRALVEAVLREVRGMMHDYSRARQAADSLSKRGVIVLVKDMLEGAVVSNRFGAEHLEVICRRAERIVPRVMKAGCVLVGPFTPTAVEDYAAGPNHVLPTAGTSRYASGLGTRDFVRMVNVTQITRKGLDKIGPVAARLARMEGLEGHARSVEVERG